MAPPPETNGTCQALNMSDGKPCQAPANSSMSSGLFCIFHGKQCYGLYRGYKRRNAQLDKLAEKPPKYLASSPKALANENFDGITTEEDLKEVHGYLLQRYNLLRRVIEARKLHSTRFYSLDLDYGHQHYVDNLQNQKFIITQALERLERRTAEFLYHQMKWFKWARKVQDDEDAQKYAEKQKIKREAALFQRFVKQVQQRQRDQREKEDLRRQDEFLEQAYQENMALREDEEEAWDPIEDAIENERELYIDLIKFFLWRDVPETNNEHEHSTNGEAPAPSANTSSTAPGDASASAVSQPSTGQPSKKKKKKKPGKPQELEPSNQNGKAAPDKSNIETEQEMRQRLRDGSDISYPSGLLLRGTIRTPVDPHLKTKPLSPEDIDQMIKDISQIKDLLFCRLLLSHASLLTVAHRASSIEEFLLDKDVTDADLRDLCLKLERPKPEMVRDACADLVRNEDEENPVYDGDEEDAEDSGDDAPWNRKKEWSSKHEKRLKSKEQQQKRPPNPLDQAKPQPNEQGGMIDFGEIDDKKPKVEKVRIKICGKYIYNYPSEAAMTRGGWMQFSVLMKDSTPYDAVQLCRNWDEFFELCILAIYGYFPAGDWQSILDDQVNQQHLQLGFIPHWKFEYAREGTSHQQIRGRGSAPRQHAMTEARNLMVGSMKRNDPVSRRFIQYIAMQPNNLLIFVRDVKTGRYLVEPGKEDLWLLRSKFGRGRAVKNEWTVTKEIGEEVFEEIEKGRNFKFGFTDVFDIYIWDSVPGKGPANLHNTIQAMLIKAHRVRVPQDIHNLTAPILKSLTRDEESQRVRDVQPNSSDVSLWDTMHGPGWSIKYAVGPGEWIDMPENMLYGEVDELEDRILFSSEDNFMSDEFAGPQRPLAHLSGVKRMTKYNIERQISSSAFERFINGYDSDWSTDESDEDEWEDEDEDGDGFDESGDEDENEGEEDDEDKGEAEADDEHEDDEPEAEDLQTTNMIGETIGANATSTDESADDQQQEPEAKRIDWGDGRSTRDIVKAIKDLPTLREQFGQLKLEESQKDNSSAKKVPDGLDQLLEDLKRESAEDEAKLEKLMEKVGLESFDDIFPDVESKRVMAQEFELIQDRERAYYFKQMFHRAEGTVIGMVKFILPEATIRKRRKFLRADIKQKIRILEFIKWAGIDVHEHRRILKDVEVAISKISLFYDDDFYDDPMGAEFKSALPHQARRAARLPTHRSYHSNKTRPKSFFEERDTKPVNLNTTDSYSKEWDKAIRPVVAALFSSGVIGTSSGFEGGGSAFAAKEPGRDYDFYIDYRLHAGNVQGTHLVDPATISTSSMLSDGRKFHASHPNSKFAMLRVWSNPYFWPLMIGFDKRKDMGFFDSQDRLWEWKFMPKDFPYSEGSIHEQVRIRLEPYMHVFKRRVVYRRDVILVMGEDERELFRLASLVTFAVQARPWFREVDVWKSFVGVEWGFVEGLDLKWWE